MILYNTFWEIEKNSPKRWKQEKTKFKRFSKNAWTCESDCICLILSMSISFSCLIFLRSIENQIEDALICELMNANEALASHAFSFLFFYFFFHSWHWNNTSLFRFSPIKKWLNFTFIFSSNEFLSAGLWIERQKCETRERIQFSAAAAAAVVFSIHFLIYFGFQIFLFPFSLAHSTLIDVIDDSCKEKYNRF